MASALPGSMKQQLRRLSPEQLKKTMQECKLILEVDHKDTSYAGASALPPPRNRQEAHQMHLYDSVVTALQRYTGGGGPPYNKLRKTAHFQKLVKATYEMDSFLDDVTSGLQDNARYQVYEVLIDLIAQHLRSLPEVPVKLPTILNQVPNVYGIVDASFPGYVKSGQFPFLVQAMRHSGSKKFKKFKAKG